MNDGQDPNRDPEGGGGGNPWVKSLLVWGGIFLALLLVVSMLSTDSAPAGKAIPYSEFRTRIAEGNVTEVQISPDLISGKLKNGEFRFDGKYYRVERGVLHTPFQDFGRSRPEIYVSGHSEQAQQLAYSQGTCWLRVVDTPEKLQPIVARFREKGIEVCLRLGLVCRETRAEAVRAAKACRLRSSGKWCSTVQPSLPAR